MARFQREMVDESIVNRPFDLDDPVSRKKELGDVRFKMGHPFGMPGIGGRIEQGVDQALLIGLQMYRHRLAISSRNRSNSLLAACHTGSMLARGDRLRRRFGGGQLTVVYFHMMDHVVKRPEEKELHEEPTNRSELAGREIEKLHEENRDQDASLKRFEGLQLMSLQ